MSTGILDYPHNYYNKPPSIYWKVNVADYVVLVFALLAVAARFYTKIYITKSSGWEDYTSMISLIAFTTFTISDFIRAFRFGAGRHTWDLPPELYNGNLTASFCSS